MISFGVIKRLEEDRAIINTHDDTESSYRILTITGMQYKPRVDDSVMILAPDNNNQSAAVVIPVKAPTGDLEEGDVQLSSEDGDVQILADNGGVQMTAEDGDVQMTAESGGVQIMSDGGDVQITAGGTNRVRIRSESATLLTILNELLDDIARITVLIFPVAVTEDITAQSTADLTPTDAAAILAYKDRLATVLRE